MGERLLTPSKVTAWLECEHYLTLRHAVDTEAMDEPEQGMGAFARLVMEKGDQHEAACLAHYTDTGLDVFEVPGRRRGETFDEWVDRVGSVLDEGHDVVFQMPFVHDGMRGIADFLERADLPDGSFTYEPVDAKLARADAKPSHVLQLAFYADAIEAQLGVLPEQLHVWLGSGQRELVRTREIRAYWHRLRARLAADLEAVEHAETEPLPCRHCEFCEFAASCEQLWRDADALHYVAGIRSSEREALIEADAPRLADLAHITEPVPEVDETRLTWLLTQARLQEDARAQDEADTPPFEQIAPAAGDDGMSSGHELLPAPDDGDVFLDFEGHPFWQPDGGLFFLFGFLSQNEMGEWVYTGRWAHDHDEEGAAAEWLVDTLHDRFARHPAAHVYHYNHTERSGLESLFAEHGLDDTRLGLLVRQGAFVDLLEVVRKTVQVGAESYGLKEVERLTGYERDLDITQGSGAVVEYDRFMARTDLADRKGCDHESDFDLARIADYNEDDVRATRALRDWLIDIRPDGVPWREAVLDDARLDEDVDALVQSLREAGGRANDLVADLLGYWGREGRAHAAQLRARAEKPDEDLLNDEQAVVGLHSPEHVGRVTPTGRKARHPGLAMRFPPQPVAPFGRGMHVTHDGSPGYWKVDPFEPRGGRLVVEFREDDREGADIPERLVENDWFDPGPVKREALTTWAQEVADAGGAEHLVDARAELLLRRPPRFRARGGPAEGRFSNDLDEMIARAGELDVSWLAVQGPPGTGKTYRGARIVRRLVLQGKRVGITAMSHAAIHNLVEATHESFTESGDLHRLAAAVKRSHGPPVDLDGVAYVKNGGACATGDFNVVAGTTWLFASSGMRENPVDVLVVDEAGQLALIDLVIAGASARNLVLLGDPQQLPQVNLATHPNGSGASALGHVLEDAKTLQPHLGIFLPETRRMHPDVAGFISDQFYEGRLTGHTSCVAQSTHLGTGLRWIRADHTGCATRAPQEVELVTAEVERVLEGTWTTPEGEERPLTTDDIMVVTPYNDQKDALRDGLADAGLGDVRVGTVDKFQGQEAPVVFFSAATSSAGDAPRGLGFVFSRNRFNVAISRARCLAYLVSTGAVLDAKARTVDEMRTLSSVCAFADAATEA